MYLVICTVHSIYCIYYYSLLNIRNIHALNIKARKSVALHLKNKILSTQARIFLFLRFNKSIKLIMLCIMHAAKHTARRGVNTYRYSVSCIQKKLLSVLRKYQAKLYNI